MKCAFACKEQHLSTKQFPFIYLWILSRNCCLAYRYLEHIQEQHIKYIPGIKGCGGGIIPGGSRGGGTPGGGPMRKKAYKVQLDAIAARRL